ncbi:hypothetical protein Ccrd_022714 [Cynara cardunculus var. scolymus]|uniref:Uncharacterized protein n=1 Tax=Cynara cardunculus var. scolymus TaxID=59895 RepID=A0A103XY07_CYNCS|nr:hypothetical protein Ccrd_022714 [Cynara cardunculus var. scolymus]
MFRLLKYDWNHLISFVFHCHLLHMFRKCNPGASIAPSTTLLSNTLPCMAVAASGGLTWVLDHLLKLCCGGLLGSLPSSSGSFTAV